MPPTISLSPALGCFRISGTALPQQQRIETFGITGVDGVGVHLLGNFAKPTSWTVKQHGSIAGLNTWFNTLAAAVGQVVTIVNDEGQSYPNQLLEAVPQPQRKTANDLAGSVELWTVQITTRTV